VRYAPNGFFKHHYDWLSNNPSCSVDAFCERGMGDRESTFFVYLAADCEGGETEFTALGMPPHLDEGLWARVLEWTEGSLRWKPKAGAAVFWENLDERGDGLESVLHAGLPVKEGSKIGLNIWTRQRVPGPCNGEYKCRREVPEGQAAVMADLSSSGGHEEL
jgi:prolyl 4-hydroxylase